MCLIWVPLYIIQGLPRYPPVPVGHLHQHPLLPTPCVIRAIPCVNYMTIIFYRVATPLSVLLYGYETWTIRKNEKDRLETMEMWIWRKMNITSWVERKTNEHVLKDVREKRNIIKHILKKKTKLIGHLFRYNIFMKNIFEGKILRKRSRERPRTSHFQDLKHLRSHSLFKIENMN
ncbi:hypothetical protein AGLY_009386 [Aphis glycines]|uniref:Uncharacterized protein n=1 Tax=Aphis glycines TaxID=307491 RepID=A0A6G0TI58_APHGL|nr:hypothetical protein AGLY_009386 [Aphis glycines]